VVIDDFDPTFRALLEVAIRRHGDSLRAAIFTDVDWTDPDADVGAYIRSKTRAEKAAWDFGAERSSSVGLIAGLLDGTMEGGMPRLGLGAVDVRDVADLHLRAIDDPAAVGQRFLAAAGDGMWLPEVAMLLREFLGGAAARVPTTAIPASGDALRTVYEPAPASCVTRSTSANTIRTPPVPSSKTLRKNAAASTLAVAALAAAESVKERSSRR
jgi:dihydroflavonol-4-reductase